MFLFHFIECLKLCFRYFFFQNNRLTIHCKFAQIFWNNRETYFCSAVMHKRQFFCLNCAYSIWIQNHKKQSLLIFSTAKTRRVSKFEQFHLFLSFNKFHVAFYLSSPMLIAFTFLHAAALNKFQIAKYLGTQF